MYADGSYRTVWNKRKSIPDSARFMTSRHAHFPLLKNCGDSDLFLAQCAPILGIIRREQLSDIRREPLESLPIKRCPVQGQYVRHMETQL